MPHKRAKRSVKERVRAERNLDLPPSEAVFTPNDIPKSMARVLNAEAVQRAFRERKRQGEEGGESGNRKKRKVENASDKLEIKIKPGESLKHFKRRVEDDMRPLIRSAMKNTTAVSKQKLKESQRDAEQFIASQSKLNKASGNDMGEEAVLSEGGTNERSTSPDFVRVSSSTPKRLNDVARAPPELKAAPRLNRLLRKAQTQKAENKSRHAIKDEESGIVTLQQKRMMELEREKAINRYRALKEAKLNNWRKGEGIEV